MNNLLTYILEQFDKTGVTTEWMKEKYKEFNELYFNNELPEIILSAKRLDDELGCQGEMFPSYTSPDNMENGMYILYKKTSGLRGSFTKSGRTKWTPIIDENSRVKSISELKPFIYMNSKYIYEELEKEDTLIHEMIHLWTYKDGFAPKQAHGKEFNKICKEIREIAKTRYNKDYSLGTRATDSSKFEVADKEEINNAIKQASLRGGGIVSIYFEVEDEKNPHRFFFCTQKRLDYTLVDIKVDHKDKLKSVYISGDSYIPMCEKFGKFKTMNNYNGYWSTEKFAGSVELLKVGDNVIDKGASDIRKMLNECFIDEDKKPYIKPEITVIEIPAKINLSKINMEDIINGVIDNFDNIDTRKTDSKMIKK